MPTITQTIFDRLRKGERLPSSVQTYFAPANEVVTSPAGSDKARSVKVHIKALGKGVIQHPIFGPVVHDFSTARIPGRVAIDDTHGNEVGPANKLSVTEYGLEADGYVTPKTDRDAAGNLVEDKDHPSSRIAYNLREGIPQSASADWRGPFDVELIPEGATMQVNGMDVTGPCLKIMNWGVRSIAICKVGVDPTALSEAQLNSAGQELAPAPGKVTVAGEKAKPENAVAPVVPVGTLPVSAAAQQNAVNNEETENMDQETEYAALQTKHAQELCQLNAEHATARAAAPADKIADLIKDHSTQLNEMYARHGQEMAAHVAKYAKADAQLNSAPPATAAPAAPVAPVAPAEPAASAPAKVENQTHALPPDKKQELALAGEAKTSVVAACTEAAASCAALATAIRPVNPEVAEDAVEAGDHFKTAALAVKGDQTNDGDETWEAFSAGRCLLGAIAAVDTAEAKAAIVSLTKAVKLLADNYGAGICCYSLTHQFTPKSKTAPATIVAPVTDKPAVDAAGKPAAEAGKVDQSAQLNSTGKVEGAALVVPVDTKPVTTPETKPEPQATDLPPDLAKQYADLGLDPKAGLVGVLQQYAAAQKTNADLQERVKKLAGGAAPVEATPVKADPQQLSWPALVNGIVQEYADKGQMIEVQQAHAIACERYKDANAKLRIPLKQK